MSDVIISERYGCIQVTVVLPDKLYADLMTCKIESKPIDNIHGSAVYFGDDEGYILRFITHHNTSWELMYHVQAFTELIARPKYDTALWIKHAIQSNVRAAINDLCKRLHCFHHKNNLITRIPDIEEFKP